MPINNQDEYDRVVNVSWYSPKKSREDLRYASVKLDLLPFTINLLKVSLRFTFLANVSVMLHRYSKLLKPILLLWRQPFPAPKGHR